MPDKPKIGNYGSQKELESICRFVSLVVPRAIYMKFAVKAAKARRISSTHYKMSRPEKET